MVARNNQQPLFSHTKGLTQTFQKLLSISKLLRCCVVRDVTRNHHREQLHNSHLLLEIEQDLRIPTSGLIPLGKVQIGEVQNELGRQLHRGRLRRWNGGPCRLSRQVSRIAVH